MHKDNALNDLEYKGNLLVLLRLGLDFVKANTSRAWVKLPDRREEYPDYDDRAVLEALVNHLIHRDYTVIGGEVHIDIYDDRMVLSSPGGMFDGSLIQERDISNVPSVRRNPILADVFTQLNYMEKRGSGLRKICEFSAKLKGYDESDCPDFLSEGAHFFTTLRNVNFSVNGLQKGLQKKGKSLQKGLQKTQQLMVEMIVENKHVTTEQMANLLGVSRQTVAKYIKRLQAQNVIHRVGPDKGGWWEMKSGASQVE